MGAHGPAGLPGLAWKSLSRAPGGCISTGWGPWGHLGALLCLGEEAGAGGQAAREADPEPLCLLIQAKLVGSPSLTLGAGRWDSGEWGPSQAWASGFRHPGGVTGEQARVGPSAQAVQGARAPAESARSPGLRVDPFQAGSWVPGVPDAPPFVSEKLVFHTRSRHPPATHPVRSWALTLVPRGCYPRGRRNVLPWRGVWAEGGRPLQAVARWAVRPQTRASRCIPAHPARGTPRPVRSAHSALPLR